MVLSLAQVVEAARTFPFMRWGPCETYSLSFPFGGTRDQICKVWYVKAEIVVSIEKPDLTTYSLRVRESCFVRKAWTYNLQTLERILCVRDGCFDRKA